MTVQELTLMGSTDEEIRASFKKAFGYTPPAFFNDSARDRSLRRQVFDSLGPYWFARTSPY